MNADLLDGDKVTFEDSGHGDNGVLANESILMRGLVVRSHGNQIRIRLRSRRPQPGSILLRYQGKSGGGGGPRGRGVFKAARCKLGVLVGLVGSNPRIPPVRVHKRHGHFLSHRRVRAGQPPLHLTCSFEVDVYRLETWNRSDQPQTEPGCCSVRRVSGLSPRQPLTPARLPVSRQMFGSQDPSRLQICPGTQGLANDVKAGNILAPQAHAVSQV